MKAAYDAGINFFDCAEGYAGGESEKTMGEAIKKFGYGTLGSYLDLSSANRTLVGNATTLSFPQRSTGVVPLGTIPSTMADCPGSIWSRVLMPV